MNIELYQNHVLVTEFDLNEDNFPANLKTLGLELLSIDEEEAWFEIEDAGHWYAHKYDDCNNFEHGISYCRRSW